MSRAYVSLITRLMLLSLLAVLACAAPVQAGLVTWDLSGVTLSDGGSVTGWIAYDPVSGGLAYSLTAMVEPLTIATLTPAVSNPFTFSSGVPGSFVLGPYSVGAFTYLYVGQYVPALTVPIANGAIYQSNVLSFQVPVAWVLPGAPPEVSLVSSASGGYYDEAYLQFYAPANGWRVTEAVTVGMTVGELVY